MDLSNTIPKSLDEIDVVIATVYITLIIPLIMALAVSL